MSPPSSVAELLALAARGDQRAWNSIVDRFTSLLWAIGRAYRLEGADVADVAQTTWLRLLENLDHIREPDRLSAWLATTARRECLRVLRTNGRRQLTPDGFETEGHIDVDAPAVDGQMLLDERDVTLWASFNRLPERCQRLLRVLMVSDPPRYAEVSAALDVPVGSIGPTRMRCLRDLEQLLRDSGYPFLASTDGGSRHG